jgi:hypothetical protein
MIIMYSKIVVSNDYSLNPRLETFTGLLHGVLGEEPQHLYDLRDQIFGFCVQDFL